MARTLSHLTLLVVLLGLAIPATAPAAPGSWTVPSNPVDFGTAGVEDPVVKIWGIFSTEQSGDDPLPTVTSYSITGPDAASFEVLEFVCKGSSQTSCSWRTRFDPTHGGTH